MTKQSGGLQLEILGHAANDAQVDPQQIVARHAGLARDTRGHDGHVAARQIVPVGRAFDAHVVAQDGAVLLQVQGLALGYAQLVRYVEQIDVAQFESGCLGRELASNVSRADECDLFPMRHERGLHLPPSLSRFASAND
jgi:hypothetical protein